MKNSKMLLIKSIQSLILLFTISGIAQYGEGKYKKDVYKNGDTLYSGKMSTGIYREYMNGDQHVKSTEVFDRNGRNEEEFRKFYKSSPKSTIKKDLQDYLVILNSASIHYNNVIKIYKSTLKKNQWGQTVCMANQKQSEYVKSEILKFINVRDKRFSIYDRVGYWNQISADILTEALTPTQKKLEEEIVFVNLDKYYKSMVE